MASQPTHLLEKSTPSFLLEVDLRNTLQMESVELLKFWQSRRSIRLAISDRLQRCPANTSSASFRPPGKTIGPPSPQSRHLRKHWQRQAQSTDCFRVKEWFLLVHARP